MSNAPLCSKHTTVARCVGGWLLFHTAYAFTLQVDWLLLHQANIRIMETVAKKIGIPFDKVLTNLNEFGNTSAGSIPLALDEAVS
jgi:3-oxoacyl-[acyl-carrier-protein] synthase III